MKKTLTTIIAATALVLTNGIGANGAVPEGRDTSNFRKWVNTLVDDEISEQLANMPVAKALDRRNVPSPQERRQPNRAKATTNNVVCSDVSMAEQNLMDATTYTHATSRIIATDAPAI